MSEVRFAEAVAVGLGGIIGAGIFLNPAIVAERVKTPFLTLAAWVLGGVIAVTGAFCFGELGSRSPRAGDRSVSPRLPESVGPL